MQQWSNREMNLSTLEQLVGPINRGSLDKGFPPDGRTLLTKEERYYDDSRAQGQHIPTIEDLSHLNPITTSKHQINAAKWWRTMTKEQREKERLKRSAAGVIGGRATKHTHHRYLKG